MEQVEEQVPFRATRTHTNRPGAAQLSSAPVRTLAASARTAAALRVWTPSSSRGLRWLLPGVIFKVKLSERRRCVALRAEYHFHSQKDV